MTPHNEYVISTIDDLWHNRIFRKDHSSWARTLEETIDALSTLRLRELELLKNQYQLENCFLLEAVNYSD